MDEIKIKELREREKEIEKRVERVERIEKSLKIQMQRMEKKLGVKPERSKFRGGEITLREIISQEGKAIRRTTPKNELGERGRILRGEMENILREHHISREGEEDKKETREEPGERKKLLRGEIEKIIKSGEKKGERKERVKELRKVEISTSWDARLLFKILLEKGVVKLDEARRQLGVDEETIQEWVEDLKRAGIVEVVKRPYGSPDLKLKQVDTALREK